MASQPSYSASGFLLDYRPTLGASDGGWGRASGTRREPFHGGSNAASFGNCSCVALPPASMQSCCVRSRKHGPNLPKQRHPESVKSLSQIRTDNGVPVTDSYDYAADSNRLLQIDDGSQTQNLTYDAVGNPISRGEDSYTYSVRNRLVAVHRQGALLADYTHNGQGQRVIKTVHDAQGATTTYFVYDPQGNIIAEADGTGQITREYVYANGERLALIDTATSAVYYYHNDHLGTPRALTDETGAVVWRGDYTPFGKVTETLALVEQPFRFPGQYADQETGLYYNYFRGYDPSLGRYLQSDPRGILVDYSDPQRQVAYEAGVPIVERDILSSLNHPYGYSGQNSINYFDETGEWFKVILPAIGIGVGLYCYDKGIKLCAEAFPRHRELDHPDRRLFMQCTSSVAKVVGLGMGISTSPLGAAATGLSNPSECEDDEEC